MSLFTRNVIISLIITGLIIGTVIFAINYLNQQRVAELNTIQDQLTTDTLSVETQYALLESAPCEDFTSTSTNSSTSSPSFSQELSDLGDKLSYAEGHLGATDPQVVTLKNQYTLLEIRDYLLAQQLSKTCNFKPATVLYFYSNNNDCKDCGRASYALSYLHQQDPALRVYSFDYNLDLPALKTLEQLYKIQPQFPAFLIDGKRVYGFNDLDSFETNFPAGLFGTTTASTTLRTK